MKNIKKSSIKNRVFGLFLLFSLLVIIPVGITILRSQNFQEKKAKPAEKSNEKSDKNFPKKEKTPLLDNQKKHFLPKKNQPVSEQKNKDLIKPNKEKNQSILSLTNGLFNSVWKFRENPVPKKLPTPLEPKEKENKLESERWMKGDDIYHFYNSMEKDKEILLLDPLYLGDLANKKGERRLSSINSLVKKKLAKNKLVFMPANHGNIHWSLFVYEGENNTFHYYDSMNNFNFAYFSPLGMEILKKLPASASLKSEKTPQQPNGNDCGVYVMVITDFLAKRYRDNSSKMNWKINKEAEAKIHKSVRKLRKKMT